ncbi:MAG: hypothetical protein JSS66_11090 [Armatimonadetes bacterium]|nr:hypothetical protein [Armatimonadota bacterium]
MDEIRRRDISVFFREFFAAPRVIAYLFAALLTWLFSNPFSPVALWQMVIAWALLLTYNSWSAYRASLPKRFKAQRFLLLWNACTERHSRFKAALSQLSKRGIADLQELPKTIEAVSAELYRAMRRADLVATEVLASEGWLVAQPRMGQPISPDKQAQELYRIADKNIAEYRQHYMGVMAGVERTEAQAAVFTTTLDTLRMKMLSYRLVGKETESPTQDFLSALTEARMQLESIDRALDELELTPFPKTVSILPDELPPVPTSTLETPPSQPEDTTQSLEAGGGHE